MELKFLLLVISLIFSVQSEISNKNVICNFKVQNKVYKDESDKHYGCLLSYSKNENSEELLGVHLSGKNDDDVEFVHSQMRQTRLPKRLLLKFCEKFKNLKIISINRRDIEEIDENIIESCHNLTEFSLTSNSIREIPENLFSKNTKLKSINLNDNEIEILPANSFKTLVNLETLFIGRNKLKELNPDWFTNLLNLKEFLAERNELTILPKGIFKPLKNLVGLHLFNNNLTIIHSDSFFLPSKLEQLSLSHNQIKAIDRKLLDESSISKVYMYPNVCNNSNMVFREETLMGLKRCFNNYQPREE